MKLSNLEVTRGESRTLSGNVWAEYNHDHPKNVSLWGISLGAFIYSDLFFIQYLCRCLMSNLAQTPAKNLKII